MLEIRQAEAQGNQHEEYSDDQAALSAHNGVLPPNTVLLHGRSQGGNGTGDAVYIISRSSAVSGRELREARVQKNPNTNQNEVGFFLTVEGGRRFAKFT